MVLVAVAVYTAFIAVMVEGNRSGQATTVMLVVSLFTAIVLVVWGRPLTMITAVVSIIVYTFIVAVTTQVATGREDDPLGNCTLAHNWQDLIAGEECE